MAFVSTDQGHIAFRDIKRWDRDAQGVVLSLADGSTSRTDEDRWDRALNSNFSAVIPAQPGTYFLTPCGEDDGSTTWQKEVVVGWGLRADGYLRPFGYEGTEYEEAVLHPNGRVTAVHGSYDNEAVFLSSRDAS